MLRPNEQKAREFMEEKFVPTLHAYLKEANPDAYELWHGNACRQTAILGSLFLDKLLPEYKWQVWDADFLDKIHDRDVAYNHAWIYGVHKNEKRQLLVDLSRNFQERLFMVTEQNEYPKDHPEYRYMKALRRVQMDVPLQLQAYEYYTGLRGQELYQELKKRIGVSYV